MVIFKFGLNIIERVIGELAIAQEYIRIAMFQIHNQAVFNVLTQKLAEGINVEIFTLPYDSIIFPTIAFGIFIPTVILGQFISKFLGGVFLVFVAEESEREKALA